MLTSRSGEGYGSERSKSDSASVYTAMLAPTPNASVTAARAVKPGDFRSTRQAYVTSFRMSVNHPMRRWSRHWSSICTTPPSARRAARCA